MIYSEQSPVFIGGTGRCGTTITARLLNSHPEFCLPAHENKLIAERGGLRDIVEAVSGRYENIPVHFAIKNFVERAKNLERHGFRLPKYNRLFRQLAQSKNLRMHKAYEQVARNHPQAVGSLHAIGNGYPLAHYQSCIKKFLDAILDVEFEEGIVDTDGLMKPFYVAKRFTRHGALQQCRQFLHELYSMPLQINSAHRWVDDTPTNALRSDFLYELYPNMKLIHMVRHPFDVISSFLDQTWFPSDPRLAYAHVTNVLCEVDNVKAAIPTENIIEIKLEDLVTNRKETIEILSDFLGVKDIFNKQMISSERSHIGRHSEDLLQKYSTIDSTSTKSLQNWMKRHAYL